MAKSRTHQKTKSSSVEFQTQIVQAAGKRIAPPAGHKLTKKQEAYWNRIIDARAEWTEIDLSSAHFLSWLLVRRDNETAALDKEKGIIKRANGTPTANPRYNTIAGLTNQIIALSVKLQIHAIATIGKSDENVNKNKQKRLSLEATAALGVDDDEDLIARPH